MIVASPGRAIGGHVPFVLNGDWMWLIGAVALLYLLALRRIKDGPPWSARRTVAFYSGLGVLLVAFVSPLDNYDIVSLFADVGQHLILMFVAAPLIALGSPVTVGLRASPVRLRRAMERGIESRTVTWLTHPAVFWTLFLAIQAGTLYTSFYNQALNSNVLHVVEHAAYFTAAFLFWWPITGMEPLPRKVSLPTRLVYLLVALPPLAAMGIGLVSATAPLYAHYTVLHPPWGGRAALEIQHEAGWLYLIVGPLVLLSSALLLIYRWTSGTAPTSVESGG